MVSREYSSLSAEEAQKIGRQLYRSKNYQDALKAFTAAVTRSDGAAIGALDNRAATYMKVGDLQAALRDAKHMIDLEKVGVTGYLRTGQILQLMNKADLAHEIYKYGLRNIPSDSPDHRLLQGMSEKLAQNRAPAKAVDFMLMLPVEIAEMIVKYLPTNNLVILLGVSKQWNQFLSSMPRLRTHLDLSCARKSVNMTAIRACVRRSRGDLTHATLNCDSRICSGVIKYLVSRSKNLHYLEIVSGFTSSSLVEAGTLARNLSTLIVSQSCDITLDAVTRILGLVGKLERAEFHSILTSGRAAQWQISSKLLSLTLSKSRSLPDRNIAWDIPSLLDQTPDISELCLPTGLSNDAFQQHSFSRLVKLRSLTLHSSQLRFLPELPSTIRSLYLGNNPRLFREPDLVLPDSGQTLDGYSLPELERLELCNSSITYQSLLLLSPPKGKLKNLDISGCCHFDTPAINQLIVSGRLDGICDLDLSNLDVDDSVAVVLAESCPQLKRLRLNSTKITGIGVKHLAQKLEGMMEDLQLLHCTRTSLDAVDFARSKGIRVAFGFPDTKKYGTSLRLS